MEILNPGHQISGQKLLLLYFLDDLLLAHLLEPTDIVVKALKAVLGVQVLGDHRVQWIPHLRAQGRVQ